jgi:HAD superfamily hydrolase (TIGR01509 family)
LRIEAVFLDFGQTLAYREPDIWDIFSEVCLSHGHRFTRPDIDRGRALADRTHRSIDFQTEESMDFFWTEWFRLILENLPVDDPSAIARDIRSRTREESRVHLYDEVKEVLASLDKLGLPLGIVSNYNCLLERNCRRLGITQFFDFILASDLIRSGKPKPLIFDLAVEEAGVPRERCVHVGDSLGADYEGATKAGLKAVLLDRPGTAGDGPPTIPDLRGVLGYLETDH